MEMLRNLNKYLEKQTGHMERLNAIKTAHVQETVSSSSESLNKIHKTTS